MQFEESLYNLEFVIWDVVRGDKERLAETYSSYVEEILDAGNDAMRPNHKLG